MSNVGVSRGLGLGDVVVAIVVVLVVVAVAVVWIQKFSDAFSMHAFPLSMRELDHGSSGGTDGVWVDSIMVRSWMLFGEAFGLDV